MNAQSNEPYHRGWMWIGWIFVLWASVSATALDVKRQTSTICRGLYGIFRLSIRFRRALWKGRAYFENAENAYEFSRLLAESGPFYVKVGQWLAQRPDVLPHPFVVALQTLQHDAPKHSFCETLSMIKAVHPDLEVSFDLFDEHPVSSGSIAQVYRARVNIKALRRVREALGAKASSTSVPLDASLSDDATVPVAVKVRHPDVVESLREDMREFSAAISVGRFFHNILCSVIDVEAVAVDMFDQCDLKREAEALNCMRQTIGHNRMVRLPVAYLATEEILVESWMPGIFYTQIGTVDDPNLRRYRDLDEVALAKDLCKRLTMATYLQMLCSTGIIHGDFHHGNILFDMEYIGQGPDAALGIGDGNSGGIVAIAAGTALRAEPRNVSVYEGQEDDVFRSNTQMPVYPVRAHLNLVDFGIVLKLPIVMRELVVKLFEAVYSSDIDRVVQMFTSLIMLEKESQKRKAPAAATEFVGTQCQWDRIEDDAGDSLVYTQPPRDRGKNGGIIDEAESGAAEEKDNPVFTMTGLGSTRGGQAFDPDVRAFYEDTSQLLQDIEKDRLERKSGASAEGVMRGLLNMLYKHKLCIDGAATRLLINFMLIEEGYASSRAYDNICENALMYVLYEDENDYFAPLVEVTAKLWGGHYSNEQGHRRSKTEKASAEHDSSQQQTEADLRRAARCTDLSDAALPESSAVLHDTRKRRRQVVVQQS